MEKAGLADRGERRPERTELLPFSLNQTAPLSLIYSVAHKSVPPPTTLLLTSGSRRVLVPSAAAGVERQENAPPTLTPRGNNRHAGRNPARLFPDLHTGPMFFAVSEQLQFAVQTAVRGQALMSARLRAASRDVSLWCYCGRWLNTVSGPRLRSGSSFEEMALVHLLRRCFCCSSTAQSFHPTKTSSPRCMNRTLFGFLMQQCTVEPQYNEN